MNQTTAKAALKRYFGYDEFRPMQAEIIQSIYDKKDVVVLMPTGGGKSLCFQIPAITMEGMCVVVSPLISLMKDQVEALNDNGIDAAFLNSSLSTIEQQHIEDEIYNGKLKLLYVSPEKMLSPQFMPLIKQANVNLFAIDEAHCISAWGHDFRPEYTQMQFLKKQFADIPIIALTATADKITRRDIIDQLRLGDPNVFVSSFDRPNISLEVRPGQKRIEQILNFIKTRRKQSGIIYCLSRKNTEQVCAKLLSNGIKAGYYHAGMSARDRDQVQTDFLNDNLNVVCATVAFGMGIDKSNVRWVIHYNMPKNMEGYYQEIGRAGRDGAKAEALLFYSFRDVTVLREILSQNESEHLPIKLSKLERIQQFADAHICRRKILLSYFGENLDNDCGNCDVCKNPPQHFDGTVLSQKALSAVIRTRERVGITMLIDILRGSSRREVIARGYNKIKTYGAGGDVSAYDWQILIQQMINSGLMEIAYDQYNVLRVTEAGKDVLFNNKKIPLVKMASLKERQKKQREKVVVKTKRERVRDELFEVLRQLRKELARKRGVPPYIIFSDATLEEMAAERPITEYDMNRISGVGEKKYAQYGEIFINAILDFISTQGQNGVKVKGTTHTLTLQLYNRGFSPEQISLERDMQLGTIYTHLTELYARGQKIDWKKLISKKELDQVLQLLEKRGEPFRLKELHEELGEQISYDKIKFAIAFYYKQVAKS